jgi:hypothetical protein
MIKPTVGLVKLCHAGMLHANDEVRDAAESVLSYVVLFLKHKEVPVPEALEGHIKTLELNVFTV